MPIKVQSVKYQRNGICGVGFYAVRFDWRDGQKLRRMIGHLYPEEREAGEMLSPVYYGVVDIDEPEAAWRGDHFAGAMLAAVRDYDVEQGRAIQAACDDMLEGR